MQIWKSSSVTGHPGKSKKGSSLETPAYVIELPSMQFLDKVKRSDSGIGGRLLIAASRFRADLRISCRVPVVSLAPGEHIMYAKSLRIRTRSTTLAL